MKRREAEDGVRRLAPWTMTIDWDYDGGGGGGEMVLCVPYAQRINSYLECHHAGRVFIHVVGELGLRM